MSASVWNSHGRLPECSEKQPLSCSISRLLILLAQKTAAGFSNFGSQLDISYCESDLRIVNGKSVIGWCDRRIGSLIEIAAISAWSSSFLLPIPYRPSLLILQGP